MRNRKQGDRPEQRVAPAHMLAAAAILGLLVMPVAFAGGGEPGATKSANVAKQLRKLKQRLAALEGRPDQVGQAPASLPPSGPAGGDLIGSYPNPLVGPNAVGGTEIDERDVPIPTAWAAVADPDGNSQPAGDPVALTQEGVLDVNDGDDGTGDTSGIHCYELGFTPDLVLVNLRPPSENPNSILDVGTGSSPECGASSDARVRAYDAVDLAFDDASVHVAFFDLE
jgi:hypothetical protein